MTAVTASHRAFVAGLAVCCLLTTPAAGAEHLIKPGESPQTVLDAAEAGDKLVFLPGLHEHRPGRHRSILYVDKPVQIELKAGATLKLADASCVPDATGEITVDQDSREGKLDDLEAGGAFKGTADGTEGPELYGATVYTVVIDHVGEGGAADSFRWGDGKLFETPHRRIAITGEWQELSHGVKVRFANRTGHQEGSLWFISYGGPAAYGIRIGHGTQKEYIEKVTISGGGVIDMNAGKNAQPSGLVKDINACVLVHGRVRGVRIEGVTMTNTMRSVMCYGEHTGKMLAGGATEGGESFDAEDITIERTRTINPTGAAYLLGHPSHRGRLRNVKCNHNDMETGLTAIEPNFNLDGYEVIDNVIKSEGQAIHCWRYSRNGTIADNLRVHDNTGKPVVVVNAPRGWKPPEPPVLRNNRNHLSDESAGATDAPEAAGTAAPNATLHFEFPNLPTTLAGLSSGGNSKPSLTAILPSDYTPDRKFPVFVYLLGGPGGRGSVQDLALGRSVAGKKGFIVVTMPLFKRKLDVAEPAGGLMVSMDDFATISDAYRQMLERFFAAIPNTDSDRSVFGGHSNGAHTTGVLLAGQDEFLLNRFGSFFLHEGGVGPLLSNVLHKRSLQGKRFLVMTAGGSGRSPAPFGATATLLKSQTDRHKLDFTFVMMEGYGHDQPPEYLRVVSQWARRENLDDVVARRKTIAESLRWPPTGHPDSSDWPDMLNADLSNSRHRGWKWSSEGVLTAGPEPLETKSDFSHFALDWEFRGNAELRLGESIRVVIGEHPDDKESLRPAGEWNRMSAVRNGTRLVVVLNGLAIRDLELPVGRVRIGLGGGEVHCRNLKLVPLP